MGFLSDDGIFGRIFGFLGKLIALNLLWMVCSLPVVTAGASTTALFYCVLKLHKDKDVRIFRDFFKSFKQNFRQSTMVWGLAAAAAVLIYMEKESIATMPGSMPQIFMLVIAAVCIPLVLILLYIFPTIAAFENKTKTLITNAFYFAVKKPGYALIVAVITILPMFMTLVDAKMFPIYLFIWLTCGFSLTAYCDAWFMWRLFKPYFKEEETKSLPEETRTDQYAF
ncbi:YesL family protein [Blautia schinkii]|nr:YesL family protein [Blautia schinkii]